MLVEIDVEVRKTAEGLFEGEIALCHGISGEKREFTFTLSVLDRVGARAHFVVKHFGKQIFSNDINELTDAQFALVNLINDVVQIALRNIHLGDVEELYLESFRNSGVEYSLTVKEMYNIIVTGQSEQLKVNKLFFETQ